MKIFTKALSAAAVLALAMTLVPSDIVASPADTSAAPMIQTAKNAKINPSPSRNMPFSGKQTRTAPFAGIKNAGTVNMKAGVQDVRLQMSSGGKWVNRSYLSPSKKTKATHSFRISIPSSAPGKVSKYRLVAVGTSKVNLWISKTQTVKYSHKANVNATRNLPFNGKQTRTAPIKGIKNAGSMKVNKNVSSMRIQQKEGSKWLNRQIIYPTFKGSSQNSYKVPLPSGVPGTSKRFRLVALETKNTKLWVSSEQVVKYPKQKSVVDSKKLRSTKIVTANADNRVHVTTTGTNRTIRMQEKVGKKWVNRTKANTGKYTGGYVSLPKTNKNKTGQFRVSVDASARYTAATSKAVKVKMESPTTYTGKKKTMRNHMKKWCPTTRIELFKASTKKGPQIIGRAFPSERRVQIASNLSTSSTKYTSIHECAHVLQHRAIEKSGKWGQLQNRLNKIYKTKGNNGVEQSADCMSVQMGAPKKHAYYTKNCGGARGKAAKAMLNGKMP